jgi:alkanesulfonate monooxygenase SsuD/methylene tetrahydromethanopterin reductase-like flavin-dependent oxidoreductase (luciferase family)
MTLSIGLSVNPQDSQWLELAREADRLGVGSIWVPEFWAYDGFASPPVSRSWARALRRCWRCRR